MISQDHDSLQETATRLVKAMGVEMAIQVCRSNYWSGMLKLIMDREEVAGDSTISAVTPLRVHSLPNAPYDMEDQAAEVDSTPIAA